jgi:hypothetical protein
VPVVPGGRLLDQRVGLQAFDRVQQCHLAHHVGDQGLRAERAKLVAFTRSVAEAYYLVTGCDEGARQGNASVPVAPTSTTCMPVPSFSPCLPLLEVHFPRPFWPSPPSWLLRSWWSPSYGAASVGEVARLAAEVGRRGGGGREAFIEAWSAQGRRCSSLAESALEAGKKATARSLFLRVYNYLRVAGSTSTARIRSSTARSTSRAWHASSGLQSCSTRRSRRHGRGF